MSRGPSMTVTVDKTSDFEKIIRKFKNDAVLVGIPASDSERKPDADGKTPAIGNAALLAIANFGSPMNNIPPWPIMGLGIRKAQEQIAEQFKLGLRNALSQGFSAMTIYYNRAGIIASNSIKKVLNSQEGVPSKRPSDATLAARKDAGFSGKKYWIVTGQMRNAITYVVKGDE